MEISKDDKIALVFNSSHVLADVLVLQLLQHAGYKQVHLFGDQKPSITHPKLSYFDFEPAELENQIEGNDLFCLYELAQAQKHLSDIKIKDLYSFQIAKVAAMKNVSQLCFLSSNNSSKTSMNFNSRIRAHLEESLNALPFWAVHIFRPSSIVDTSGQSRWGEKIADRLGRGLDRVTGGMVSKFRPTEASLVARTMIKAAQQLKEGRFLYHASYFVDLEEQEKGLRKAP
ncbi:MAG: hypothetical protein AAF849_10145 [Bacteroidota bacterium]